ncbi:MAG TPA: class I SAM-dependent methyltransferase [Acidobacteriota bacterium]|nr:class I SAM-dependent methyltransferase [Acidobacteriota bacterium]HNB73030.1 class I SAM-dependent methyltransferase [Acidobacteriota bacterium]HNC42706.1 class I SAM-dependent methyltransferase [Acidobacteriota bacterium]HND21755.1 class I SAM-dependent methyltransferase [Acidobacteriota bacterium]HNG93881.1 class I SAM-dependent methyltransferase [Acidobacteriota bacterium]
MNDPILRFSTRVENYVKYRPSYPKAILTMLEQECGLTADSVIADIGSGTGFSAVLFLDHGNQVYGIEPNLEMRTAGEAYLARYPKFVSLDARSEATTLPDHSLDFVVCGQSFHWFDRQKTQAEFQRILKSDGWVVILWNDRITDSTPLLRAYEDALRKYSTDYSVVNHRRIEYAMLAEFFGGEHFQVRHFENIQEFDATGFIGRVLSSSYVPEPGHPNYEPLMTLLQAAFDEYHQDGKVYFEYDTQVFFGKLKS